MSDQEHAHGDTPPHDAHQMLGLEDRIKALKEFDKEAVRDIIGYHLMLPAVLALRDGLAYRNKKGAPSRSFLREFNAVVKLAGDPPQLAAQIVAMIGMPIEQARPMLEQGQQIQGLDAHELARRAIKSLLTYRSAFPQDFADLCESFGIDVQPVVKERHEEAKRLTNGSAAASSKPARARPLSRPKL